MATVDQALTQLISDYGPDISYVRDGGGTGVAAAVIPDINTKEIFTHPHGRRNAADKISGEYK